MFILFTIVITFAIALLFASMKMSEFSAALSMKSAKIGEVVLVPSLATRVFLLALSMRPLRSTRPRMVGLTQLLSRARREGYTIYRTNPSDLTHHLLFTAA